MGKCLAKNLAADWLDEKVWNDCVNFINNPGQLLIDLSFLQLSRFFRVDHIRRGYIETYCPWIIYERSCN